jgi:hypothetical protein
MKSDNKLKKFKTKSIANLQLNSYIQATMIRNNDNRKILKLKQYKRWSKHIKHLSIKKSWIKLKRSEVNELDYHQLSTRSSSRILKVKLNQEGML